MLFYLYYYNSIILFRKDNRAKPSQCGGKQTVDVVSALMS
jgi:hypothetical protein